VSAFLASAELAINSANQRIDVSRLHDITVYFVLYSLNRTLKSWIAGQQNRNALGMSVSHGTYDSEAIAILSDVEIRYQYVELVAFHFGKCFGYGGRDSYVKTASLQDCRESGTNPFLVIYE
jgi:hypothetical protein